MSGILTRTRQFLWRAIVNFHRDDCLNLCATVSFYSLLSLGPLIYLGGASLNLIYAGSDGLALAVDRLSVFLPEQAASVLRRISPGLRTSEGIVLIALPALIWVATTALSALEHAVNVAFETARTGNPFLVRLKTIAILVLGWAGLGLSLFYKFLFSLIERYQAMLELPALPRRLSGLGSHLGLTAACFLIFVLFYKWLPRTRVRWRAAGLGALVAVVLWEAARRVFAGILLRSPAYGLLTGTLAGIISFLLWIYTAVAIVLLGAEMAALINGNRLRPDTARREA